MAATKHAIPFPAPLRASPSSKGTSGNLDGQQRLVVKGRFLPKVFEGILRRYISASALLSPLLTRHLF